MNLHTPQIEVVPEQPHSAVELRYLSPHEEGAIPTPTDARGLLTAVLREGEDAIGMQIIYPLANQQDLLAQIPQWARGYAAAAGLPLSIFGFGPLSVNNKSKREGVVKRLFRGIFATLLPNYTGIVANNPFDYLAPADKRGYERNKDAAKALAKGMRHSTILLDSADQRELETMRSLGMQEGWALPREISPHHRLLGKVIMAPKMFLKFVPGRLQLHLQHPIDNTPDIALNTSIFWQGPISITDIRNLTCLFEATSSWSKERASKATLRIELSPSIDVFGAMAGQLKQEGMQVVGISKFYRAVLTMR